MASFCKFRLVSPIAFLLLLNSAGFAVQTVWPILSDTIDYISFGKFPTQVVDAHWPQCRRRGTTPTRNARARPHHETGSAIAGVAGLRHCRHDLAELGFAEGAMGLGAHVAFAFHSERKLRHDLVRRGLHNKE
jgi:hypothetical protein